MKKLMLVQCIVLSAIVGSIQAAAWWTDAGSDHLWSNSDNWRDDSSFKPPVSSDSTFIRFTDMVSGGIGPLVEDGIDAVARNLSFEVGAGSLIEMTMTGGSLTLYEAGATNVYLRLGAGASTGKAVLNMSGGVLTVRQQDNGGGGLVRVGSGYGGEIHMSGDALIDAFDLAIDPTFGLVDLRDNATIILGGDRTSSIQTYMDVGTLRGYGTAENIRYDYDSLNPGKTTIWTVPEPSTLMLLGLGGLAFSVKRRKQSKQNF